MASHTQRNSRDRRVSWLALLAAVIASCTVPSADLERRACDTTHPCSKGYVCIEEECEPADGLVDAAAALGDSGVPGSDAEVAASDAEIPEGDSGLPPDASLADLDAAEPGQDAAEPGSDAAEPGLDAGGPGQDAAEPGLDAGVPGLDAAEPGLDAAAPGLDAAEPGLDAAEPGLDAAGPGRDAHVLLPPDGGPMLVPDTGVADKPDAGSGSCYPGSAAMLDDFYDASTSDQDWDLFYDVDVVLQFIDGTAQVFVPAVTNEWGQFISRSTFDLRGSQVTVLVRMLPDPAEKAQAFFAVQGATAAERFEINSGEGSVGVIVNGVVGPDYVPSGARYWRIRETGGVVTLETSDDGSAWTCMGDGPTPAWYPTATLQLGAGAYGPLTAGTTAQFEEVWLEPATCQKVACMSAN